jgi:hypothetical protein
MAEQFLHRPDVVPALEQVRRERIAEHLATDALRESRPADRRGHRTLNDGPVDVILRRRSKSGVSANPRGWKHELPASFRCRVRIFPVERRRKDHAAKALRQIALMPPLHLAEMLGQTGLD